MNNDSTPYASAIGAANQTGSFLFSPMKPALSYGDQVRRMQERGLVIDDHARMSRLLTTLFVRGYAEKRIDDKSAVVAFPRRVVDALLDFGLSFIESRLHAVVVVARLELRRAFHSV